MKIEDQSESSAATMVPPINPSDTLRYPTRSSLRIRKRFASSEVGGIKNSEEDQGLVACRRRRKRGRHTPCLCKDIIINILLRLPARVLYEVMRRVCKEWNNIVSDPLFVSAHLHLASRGIIVQDRAKLNMVFNLQTSSAGLKVTKLRIPFPAILLGSCNGLLLLHDWTNPEVLHVMNLVTKAKISLPPVEGLTIYCGWFISMASTSSGLYKVLRVSRTCKKEVELMVYTVGVDKDWRVIDLEGMTMCDSLKTALLFGPPLISGYVYWLHPSTCTGYALDVDTETMHQFPAPEDYVHTCRPLYNINMVTSQGMIHSRRGGKWEVWELVERKSGIWKNVMVIDEDVVNSRLQEKFYPRTSENVRPLIILKNGELWLSCVVDKAWALVCYDLRKGNILVFPIKKAAVYVVPYLHVDTLLSLKNC